MLNIKKLPCYTTKVVRQDKVIGAIACKNTTKVVF